MFSTLSIGQLFNFMALTKEQKKEKLKELQDKLKKQKSAVFVDIDGLKNKDVLVLREKLREKSTDFVVSKKTLTKMAFTKNEIPLDETLLSGRLGLIFNYNDEFGFAKDIFDFSKGNKSFNILGGLLDNVCISKEKVTDLALMPSREVLYGSLLSCLNAPIVNFLSVCQGSTKGLINALKQIK